ncbi:MAG: phosphatidylcholine/phosphatidylserine synthase [Planctomycetaceae bacterium]
MRRGKVFAVLPTLLTLGNAACGFGAITFAAKVGFDTAAGNELFFAATLIFVAMVFDMLDGSAARWARQTTDFGAQLDSLCDALSFGAAPAFLMLQFNKELAAKANDYFAFAYFPRFLWVIAALYVVCALLRLARFNVETDDDDSHEFFSGLPSPAAAGTVASFPIAITGLQYIAKDPSTRAHQIAEWLIPLTTLILPLITFAVACLMVSRIRYSHVFNQLFRGQRPRAHLIQLVFTLAVVFLVPYMALPLIFCYFAFASPLRAAWSELISRRMHPQVDKTAEP